MKTIPLGIAVGTSGEFTLMTPFDADLTTVSSGEDTVSVIYTIISTSTIASEIQDGLDVQKVLYKDKGLTAGEYTRDLKAGIKIITLASEFQKPVKVPESYVSTYPKQNTIPYYNPVLTVPLGPWAKSTDFAALIAAVAATVSDTIGIEPGSDLIKVNGVPIYGSVSVAKDKEITTRRQVMVTNRETDHAQVLALQQRLDNIVTQNIALQKIIYDNGLIIPT